MITYQLELDGISIEIQRKSVKNMTLRIYPPDGIVRVSVPIRLSECQIRRQIEGKRDWIQQQLLRIKTRPVPKEPKMLTGEYHNFLGEPYLLIIMVGLGSSSIELRDETLYMTVKPTTTELEKRALLENWYRIKMNALLPDLINKWQTIIGVNVAEWGIKNMKTRWGSCNTRAHRIWLNLALIKKPIACLEAVIVHEMVHLLEASHNSRFYSLMDQFMPEWRQAKMALKS